MMDFHPTESLLLDYVAGTARTPGAVEEHIAFCTQCRDIVDRFRKARLGDDDAFDDLDHIDLSPEAPSAPAALIAALADADKPHLAVGQLWRAAPKGEGDTLLVWIRRLRPDGRPAVVPVTFDSEFADRYDVIVPADRSPLGVELAFHTTAEGTIDQRALVDRIADMDVSSDIEAVRRARREGLPVVDVTVGAPVPAIYDERVEYRNHLSDLILAMSTPRLEPNSSPPDEASDERIEPDLQDDALDDLFDDEILAEYIRELELGLAYTYPQCRLLPAAWTDAPVMRPIGTLINVDVFVRLVLVDVPRDVMRLIDASRATFDADLSANAVCFSTASDEFPSWLFDRDAVRAADGDYVGAVQPDMDRVLVGTLVEVLTKYFDRVVDPFRVVSSTVLDEVAVDPSALAIQAGSAAVDQIVGKAAGYKIPGKQPGYERVGRQRQLVIAIVEQALRPGGVDVRSALGDDQ